MMAKVLSPDQPFYGRRLGLSTHGTPFFDEVGHVLLKGVVSVKLNGVVVIMFCLHE